MSVEPENHTTKAGSAPSVQADLPTARWKTRVAYGAGSLLATAACIFVLQRSGEAAPGPSVIPAADVPHIEGDRVSYSAAFAQRAGIRLQQVRVEALVPVVAAVGTADFNGEHVAAIGTRLRGLVSRVTRFEGDAVEKGAVLARVESAELGEAQAAISMLSAEQEAAERNQEREASLAERDLTTAREAEVAAVDAKKAELRLNAAKQKVAALGGDVGRAGDASLGSHDVRSPIKGTVVERNVAPGQFVEGHLVAFKVANLDDLWIELDVFERNLGRIRVGDRAELKPLSGAGALLLGTVAKIASRIDPETHSAKVRIDVENTDRRLRVGQAVKATIHASGGEPTARPVVPTSAITFVDGKPTLFVVAGANLVRVASVKLGVNDGEATEVLDGVSGTDQVVVDGAFALKSELFR